MKINDHKKLEETFKRMKDASNLYAELLNLGVPKSSAANFLEPSTAAGYSMGAVLYIIVTSKTEERCLWKSDCREEYSDRRHKASHGSVIVKMTKAEIREYCGLCLDYVKADTDTATKNRDREVYSRNHINTYGSLVGFVLDHICMEESTTNRGKKLRDTDITIKEIY